MTKHLGNSLLALSILLINNVFWVSKSVAAQTISKNSTQIQTQYPQQTNTTNNNSSVVGQPIDLKSINPTDTVAVVTGNGNSEPNVFKTDKKIFPPSFTGWVYIMSGADYLDYINDDNGQMKQQNYDPSQNKNRLFYNHQAANTLENVNNQQYVTQPLKPNFQNKSVVQGNNYQILSNNTQATVAQNQTVSPQPTRVTANAIPQHLMNNEQYVAMQQPTTNTQLSTNQQTPTTPKSINNVVSGGEIIDQGKPDNETPEVLIHDGAVYTLANSVEVTKQSQGNTTNLVNNSVIQQENTPLVRKYEQIPQPLAQPIDKNNVNTLQYPNNENAAFYNNGINENNNQTNLNQLLKPPMENPSNTMVNNSQSVYQQQGEQQQNNLILDNQNNGNQNNFLQQQN